MYIYIYMCNICIYIYIYSYVKYVYKPLRIHVPKDYVGNSSYSTSLFTYLCMCIPMDYEVCHVFVHAHVKAANVHVDE